MGRSSLDLNSFQERFAIGVASEEHRRVRNSVQAALIAANPTSTDSDTYVFLRHFVLIVVNLLHEGSTDEAHAIGLLSRCLSASESARAHELWQKLTLLAREGSGRAAQFDRTSLLGRVRGQFRFTAAPSLQDDLARLTEESAAALAEIANEVDGVHSPRLTVVAEVGCVIAEYRFVQIAGLPGVGKSAIMRDVAVSYVDTGAVLFLKADRLHGKSWPSYCAELGLTRAPLKSTLVEIAAAGTAIVFVDGLDRVEVCNRGVVNDILNLLATDTELADWRVVVTVRGNGLEPLRNWLSPKWLQGGATIVEVKPFSDEEAAILADARPNLKGLLFGDLRLQELTCRPFSAAMLAGLSATGGIATEVDLADAWWIGGGYDALSDRVGPRQRTLIKLAQEGGRTFSLQVKHLTSGKTANACGPSEPSAEGTADFGIVMCLPTTEYIERVCKKSVTS